MNNGASSYRRFLAGEDEALSELIRCHNDGLVLYINSIVNKSVSSDVNYETEKNMEYLGDLNDDKIIDASDASFALAEYSKRATE